MHMLAEGERTFHTQQPTVLAAREKIVGWYSTGPRLREADLSITDLMTGFADTPLLVICEVEVSHSSLRLSATAIATQLSCWASLFCPSVMQDQTCQCITLAFCVVIKRLDADCAAKRHGPANHRVLCQR